MRKIRGWMLADKVEDCVCITAPKRCKEHRLYSFEKIDFLAVFTGFFALTTAQQFFCSYFFSLFL